MRKLMLPILVPKIPSPASVTEIRPISLCNVIYKLISKVLANRLKVVLPNIISHTRSGFISGRLITYNILAAYESMHNMQSRMWSKMGFMGLKLDMSKAYDKIGWEFLEVDMTRLGFASKWMHLVMACVRLVFYSVVLNGNPTGCFKPTRGISKETQSLPICSYCVQRL
jgi:hypothetical protein